MDVLGISCFFHDAAAALVRDGDLIAAAEEERFSRRKHDASFPAHAIEFCLRTARTRPQELDYVVFYEKPLRKLQRIADMTLGSFPRSRRVFRDAAMNWLGGKLWIRRLITKHLGVPPERVLFSEHHLSHAASAFFCSPFADAAILTVDGVGEWATATYGHGKDREITIHRELHFPHSLGLLYSTFTAFLGFEVNEGEYKVMGMAPFGEPRYVDKISKLVRGGRDGSLELDLDYFAFHYSVDQAFSGKFEELFGPPRPPETRFFTSGSGYPAYFGEKPADYARLAKENQYYADIAASIQRVTEEIVLAMANHAYRETGLPRLCLAGGVALNSVANGRVLRETPFEEIYIQPAAGDGGGAVGAALYGYHMVLGKPRQFVMGHAYWGEEHTPEDINRFLRSQGVTYTRVSNDDALLNRVVDDLTRGKVVGWMQGRFEWGPRALGHRSILADPRRADMKDIVNVKIKFREPYRPFAPSVLAERAEEFFDLSEPRRHYPARFMLYVVNVKDGRRDLVPATTHVDGTARIQTVERDVAPRYHELIRRFGEATGVPVILNTSFNLRGEPIVNTPAEAFSSFQRSGMDVLIIDDCIIEKRDA